ncbi:MAG: DUF2231 domain-containing protein [Saprospiraceae bacterium]
MKNKTLDFYINIARFHPLLVHLPIGMLFLALLFELINWRKGNQNLVPAITITLNVSLVASLFAIATGWFLGDEGGYNADLLFWHKWLGISMTGLLAILCLLRWRKQYSTTRYLLIVIVLLLSAVGHYGGSLTHGEDYLFTKEGGAEAVIVDVQQAAVFTDIIRPILQKKCMACHNPSKTKGDLLMTTIEGIKAGGKKGDLIDFGAPMKSALLTRVHLPKSDKEHMPPKGKKQLTEDEILLLEWWMKNEACFDCKVKDTEDQTEVETILGKYAGTQKPKLKKLPLLTATQLTELKSANISAQQLATDNPYLIVNLAQRKDLDKKTFKALRKVGEYVLELNLQNSNFSDNLASYLSDFPQLQKLQLQNTNISNNTLTEVVELKKLESLNIYGTALDDESIDPLKQISALQRLYCWQTKITNSGIENLQKAKPLLNIQHNIAEDLFGGAALNPPKIIAGSKLFVDTVEVRFEDVFRGATAYYTLDGSEPDSTSTVFKDSIVISETSILKVFCAKEGWESSNVRKVIFRKAGLALKSIELSKPPSDDYKGKGAETLMDRTQGTTDLKDGNWLGYQGENISLIAELDSAQQVGMIALSTLSSPGPWVFFPKGLKVYTSLDGKEFQLVGEEEYDIEQEGNYRKQEYFEISFEPQQARFFKMEIIAYGSLPDWHPNAGEDSWLFIDEVEVK